MKPPDRQSLGKTGETIASEHLRKKGYCILERNFRKRYGEIDIIALDGQTLVFVEVKARIGLSYGSPEEAVTARKLREVTRTAEFYKSLHPELPELLRIDVVAIRLTEEGTPQSINHIENVSP